MQRPRGRIPTADMVGEDTGAGMGRDGLGKVEEGRGI